MNDNNLTIYEEVRNSLRDLVEKADIAIDHSWMNVDSLKEFVDSLEKARAFL
jgi:RNase adaptor protein for sRNA GlmZ degradation